MHGVDKPKWVYVDERGKIWSKRMCPDCFQIAKLAPRSSKPARPEHAKGHESERVVKLFIEGCLPYSFVELGSGKGPDLYAYRLGRVDSFEVKTVSTDKRSGNYYVNKVSSGALGCTFIALVYPDKSVKIERMEQHLAQCSPYGARTKNL